MIFRHNADIWAATDQKKITGDFRCKKETTQTWLWFEKEGRAILKTKEQKKR